MKRLKKLSILLSVILLFTAFPPATMGSSLESTHHSERRSRVVIRVLRWKEASRQLNMDKDWEVVKKEWRKSVDPVTGKPVIQLVVVREGPPDPKKVGDSMPCGEGSCKYLGLLSYEGVGYQGGVTGRIKVYEDVYEYREPWVVRQHYAPKWAYIWWYRDNSSWNVLHAYYTMGCSTEYGMPAVCDTCSGGEAGMQYVQKPKFDPMWENNTTTYVYSYYFSGYQPLHADPPLSENVRSSHADVFLNGGYQGEVWVPITLQ